MGTLADRMCGLELSRPKPSPVEMGSHRTGGRERGGYDYKGPEQPAPHAPNSNNAGALKRHICPTAIPELKKARRESSGGAIDRATQALNTRYLGHRMATVQEPLGELEARHRAQSYARVLPDESGSHRHQATLSLTSTVTPARAGQEAPETTRKDSSHHGRPRRSVAARRRRNARRAASRRVAALFSRLSDLKHHPATRSQPRIQLPSARPLRSRDPP